VGEYFVVMRVCGTVLCTRHTTTRYVLLCPLLAAGIIAEAGNRNYVMSCFVVPYFLPCIYPCWRANDRAALADKLGVEDDISWCSAVMLGFCGCGFCLLCQEYNTLRAYDSGKSHVRTMVTLLVLPALVAAQVEGLQTPSFTISSCPTCCSGLKI
jgi:hypothetical protein